MPNADGVPENRKAKGTGVEVLFGELADCIGPSRLADTSHYRLVELARSERVLTENLTGLARVTGITPRSRAVLS